MAIKNIGIFGKRNAGKSSLINLLVGQEVAIVSSVAGTTNDPVKKRIEIPGIGICNLIDTPGIDDSGNLGELRVKKSLMIADQIDMAILLYTANSFGREESDLMKLLASKEVPTLIIHNQSDIMPLDPQKAKSISYRFSTPIVDFSCSELDAAKQKQSVDELIAQICKMIESGTRTIMQGLVKQGGTYVLICPIDEEAPKERLILPQVMAIRDILDNNATAIVLQPAQLHNYLENTLNVAPNDPAGAPLDSMAQGLTIDMIVTDSSVFKQVSQIIDSILLEKGLKPHNLPLTSFSILLTRMKGHYNDYLRGAAVIDSLKHGDEVLIMESCTHHLRCADIGRVKLPAMLPSGLKITFVSGLDEIPAMDSKGKFPYSLAIQCGGCMATARQIHNRVQKLLDAGVPVTNFGMAIGHVTGILNRVTDF